MVLLQRSKNIQLVINELTYKHASKPPIIAPPTEPFQIISKPPEPIVISMTLLNHKYTNMTLKQLSITLTPQTTNIQQPCSYDGCFLFQRHYRIVGKTQGSTLVYEQSKNFNHTTQHINHIERVLRRNFSPPLRKIITHLMYTPTSTTLSTTMQEIKHILTTDPSYHKISLIQTIYTLYCT